MGTFSKALSLLYSLTNYLAEQILLQALVVLKILPVAFLLCPMVRDTFESPHEAILYIHHDFQLQVEQHLQKDENERAILSHHELRYFPLSTIEAEYHSRSYTFHLLRFHSLSFDIEGV